jgi:hypothetical protein
LRHQIRGLAGVAGQQLLAGHHRADSAHPATADIARASPSRTPRAIPRSFAVTALAACRGSPPRRAERDPGGRQMASAAQPHRRRRPRRACPPHMSARRTRVRRTDSPPVAETPSATGASTDPPASGPPGRGDPPTPRRNPRPVQAGHGRDRDQQSTAPGAKTVCRYARATTADELITQTPKRGSHLDPHADYLAKRWQEGCTNAVRLTAAIRARGDRGSKRSVRVLVQAWRTSPTPPSPTPACPPTPRQVTSWTMRPSEKVTTEERAQRATHSPALPDPAHPQRAGQ